MKTVRMKQTITGAVKIYEADRVYTVSDRQAIRWRKAGVCEWIDDPIDVTLNVSVSDGEVEMAVVEPEPEKAVQKPRRKRKTEAE